MRRGPGASVASGLRLSAAPLPSGPTARRFVVYRSSQPVTHPRANGDIAIDNRYVGTLTFRGVRPVSYGAFDDVQTYTVTTSGHGSSQRWPDRTRCRRAVSSNLTRGVGALRRHRASENRGARSSYPSIPAQSSSRTSDGAVTPEDGG